MTDPRTNAELADYLDALNAGTIARDPEILRAAASRLRAMDEALDWALAEIDLRTKYTKPGQRAAALAKARTARGES